MYCVRGRTPFCLVRGLNDSSIATIRWGAPGYRPPTRTHEMDGILSVRFIQMLFLPLNLWMPYGDLVSPSESRFLRRAQCSAAMWTPSSCSARPQPPTSAVARWATARVRSAHTEPWDPPDRSPSSRDGDAVTVAAVHTKGSQGLATARFVHALPMPL
jgi:hypothetical protein